MPYLEKHELRLSYYTKQKSEVVPAKGEKQAKVELFGFKGYVIRGSWSQ